MPADHEETELARGLIERLAFGRESASGAELRAAEIVAGALAGTGAEPCIEAERVHGTHWWPFGLPTAAALFAGLSGRRATAALVGAAAAVSVIDDAGGGQALLRRRLLPQRTTWNVVAELGDPDATRRLIVCSHHDSAHGGITFEEPLATLFARGSTRQTFAQIAGGPALISLGALSRRRSLLRAGIGLAALTVSLMADIGRRSAVPGANDNAAGCAALVLLACSLVASPPPAGLRVTLLSTGSEESWLEGMRAFFERHAGELDPETTTVLCLDSIGFPVLSLRDVEEDALRAHQTPPWLAGVVAEAAADVGVPLERGFPGAFPTDALIAHHRGIPAATLVSFDENGRMPGYHTQRDTPEHVHLRSVIAAARIAEAVARRL